MWRGERGAALLEVLAAVVILATAGLALSELLVGATRAGEHAARHERTLEDQERLLIAYTLLERRDLDLRLGARDVGPYVVTVQRPERELYRIAISERRAPDVENLVTVVFRRDETREAP